MRVGVALGSNIGERLDYLRAARNRLFAIHEDGGPFLCSRVYETEPEACPEGSPLFLNAAIEMASSLPPLDLLAELQRIEQELGRPHEHGFHAPRTIDLDILYYDNLAFKLADLELPHPRLAERAFVLRPLADVCPDRILPGFEISIRHLLEKIPTRDLPIPVANL